MTLGSKDNFRSNKRCDCGQDEKWLYHGWYLCGICISKLKQKKEEERREKHGKIIC